MPRKIISEKEFIKRFSKIEGYSYISGYERMSHKINVIHDICGEEFSVVAASFLNRPRCKYCANRTKTTESYAKQINEKTNGEYLVVGEYINDETEVMYYHCECANEFSMKPRNFTRGHRCTKCGRKHNKYSLEELNEICKSRWNNHTVVDAYVDNKSIVLRCDICGKEKIHSLQTFKTNKININNKCCINKLKELKKRYIYLKKNTDKYLNKNSPKFNKNKKYLEDANDIHGTTLDIKTNVFNTHDRFNVTCKICNNKFETNFKNLRRGNGCPKCNISKGERKINNYLIRKNITFKWQYMFDDNCVNKLKFDFAIMTDSKVLFLIEYDGKQHFSVDNQFGENKENAKKKFAETKRRDELKNRYSNVKNIPLLRISYLDYENIESIIDSFWKQIMN